MTNDNPWTSGCQFLFQVDAADRVLKKGKKTGGDNVADILEKVINQRFDVFQDSTDSDFDDEDDSDFGDWSD